MITARPSYKQRACSMRLEPPLGESDLKGFLKVDA